MKQWTWAACVLFGAGVACASPVRAAEGVATAATAASRTVVEIKPDRIILMDLVQAGNRLIAVGERGFTLFSDDGGKSWKAVATPVDRTLTGVAFRDANVGVAVGHGGSLVRTQDAGKTWVKVPMEDAGADSLLGVASLGGDHFVTYGAFGLYFDSTDAGRTWQRRMVIAEDFDRHISQVLAVGNSLLMVAESGTLARSDDGGVTWTALASPYEGSYFGALATRSGAVVIFGMRGNVYRSADAGATWQKIRLDTTASLMAGRQLADGRVLLVGNSGLLAVSNDDCQTLALHWAPQGQGFGQLVEAGGRIILAGETGVGTLEPAWLEGNKTAAVQ